MTDNMFDNFVREKLNDHQSPVPQGLWEKIERKKDKDPKGGFWLSGTALWAGLVFIIISMGAGYYLMQRNETFTGKNDEQLNKTAAAKNSSLADTHTDKNATEGNGTTPLANTINDNITANTNSTTTYAGDNKTTTTTNNTITDKTKSPNGGKKGTMHFKNEKDAVAFFRRATKAKPSKPVVVTMTLPGGYRPGDKMASNNKNTGAKQLVNRKGKSATYTKANAATDEVVATSVENNEPLTTEVAQQKVAFTKGKLAMNLRTLSSGSKDKFDLSSIKIAAIDCPTAGTVRRNDWYLEVYGSPDMAMKTVSAKTNPIYVQKKDSTETTQVGYTAGFRITKSITDNLLVKAGLQYSQINERFDLRTENERRITTVITIRTITTPSGTDTTIRDTTSLEQIGYSLRRTYNRYRSFDVPVLLSYEFGNDNLKFALNAGVILNLRSWYTGETLNDSLNVVSLNSKTAPTYKQNIGLGIYAGFSVMKPIAKNFDVFLEPYFRYNLSNMATGSAYTQKFNAAGLSFGIRYKLNRQHH